MKYLLETIKEVAVAVAAAVVLGTVVAAFAAPTVLLAWITL